MDAGMSVGLPTLVFDIAYTLKQTSDLKTYPVPGVVTAATAVRRNVSSLDIQTKKDSLSLRPWRALPYSQTDTVAG